MMELLERARRLMKSFNETENNKGGDDKKYIMFIEQINTDSIKLEIRDTSSKVHICCTTISR